ncbi:glutathione S-transferase family protein [Legionella spiritensis]|uniref:GST N-terminal domain-containing protein n=1 Tax=Legionella spiritensis TaxID=452 RepID=A0A0W0Z9G7_LEGSP|nr:glutathione S-transferase family protein [Legionella spiritensis]KTD65689.1 hypothetical protein Lspi_0401 [Legionella spiritensis]SNV43488.1 Uncharacterised protein [Legionella spiritensis]VEG90652.1 Uncharacterised protein [Legionella spiritensis]
MITLYQFPGIWGLPNASPFCLKLETYLRMVELPYDIRFVANPRKSPKGKLPCLKIDNQMLADSELIIDFLKKKFGDVLDKDITDEQKALSTFIDNTLSEKLYWIMVYFRWQDEEGWRITKNTFFGQLSFFYQLFIPNMVRKMMKKTLYMQGTGRHTRDELLFMAYKILDATSEILGHNKYFLGNQITSVDASAFGFLANIVWLPFNDPLKIYLQNKKNILQYCDRIWSTFYPELRKPFAILS